MEMEGLEKRLLMGTTWRLLVQRWLVPRLVRFAQLPPRADALEIGAGGGFAAETLLDWFPGWRMTVTDYDDDMLDLARARLSRFSHRARVERANAASLPYENRSFDLVISILVWHHVEGWQEAVADAARVLRPGSLLLSLDLLHPFPSGALHRLRLHGTYGFDQFRAALVVGGFDRWRVDRGPAWCLALAQRARDGERSPESSGEL